MKPLALRLPSGAIARALATVEGGRVVPLAYDPNQPRDEHGRWTDIEGMDRAELLQQGSEYEGRIFGGAYSWARVEGRMAAKDAPIRRAILQARERYNAIRSRLGLEPVVDWKVRPAREYLVQFQPKDHAEFAEADVKHSLDALETRSLGALRDALSECRDVLIARVKRASDLAKLVNALKKLPRFGDVQAEIRVMLDRAWERGAKDAYAEVKVGRQEVRGYAGAESSFTPNAAVRWLRATAFWVAGILGDRVLADAKAVILSGLKTGKATGVISEELYAAFLPWLGDPGVIRDAEQLAPYRLETIVRTNTTTAYNHGRLTEFMSEDTLRFLKGVRYSAVLDTRTTEVCRYLDGKVFKPSNPDLEALLPPNHYNCFISPRTKVMTAEGWKNIGQVCAGDLVLTHRGRFRAVTFAHHVQAPRTHQGDVVEVWFGDSKAICTPEHPFLTERGWRAAKDLVKEQDKVVALARECAASCGAWIPEKAGNGSDKRYCSTACQLKHEYSTGTRNALRGLEKAHAKMRTLYAAGVGVLQRREVQAKAAAGRARSERFRYAVTEGRRGKLNPMHRNPESMRKNGERLVRRWRDNPELHPNRNMVNVSKPQRRLFETAKALRVHALLEHPIRIGERWRFLDVALPEQKIALEYDGHYWHRDAERDARRALEIERAGWSLLVYRGRVPTEQQLRADLDRVERNHAGEYRFASFTVTSIRKKALRRSVRLYNLAVSEDESYIVGCGGAVVHNCRSIVVPVVAGEKIDEAEFITPAEIGRARSLADAKFLSLVEDAWRAYREPEEPPEPEVVVREVPNPEAERAAAEARALADEAARKQREAEVRAEAAAAQAKRAEDAVAVERTRADAIARAAETERASHAEALKALAARPVEVKVQGTSDHSEAVALEIENLATGARFRVWRIPHEGER